MSHWAGEHWYGTEGAGTGVADPPDAPTLAVNASGTLATVSGSEAGSSNSIQVSRALVGLGTYDWTEEATRTGDGTAPLTLDPGLWWGRVVSTTSGGTAVSNLVLFRVGSPANRLLHSPADILRRVIIAMGYGADPSGGDGDDWPVYAHSEPGSPDSAVTVYDTSGKDDGRIQWSGERAEHYGVQVRVRSGTSKAGYAKADEIAKGLDQEVYQASVVIEGTSYLVESVTRQGGILSLGKEPSSRRHLHTFNAVVTLRVLE